MEKLNLVIADGLLVERTLFEEFVSTHRLLWSLTESKLVSLGITDEQQLNKARERFIYKCLPDLGKLHKDTIVYLKKHEYRTYYCPMCKNIGFSFREVVICEKCCKVFDAKDCIREKSIIIAIHKGSNNSHFLLQQNEMYYLNLKTGVAVNRNTFRNLYQIEDIITVYDYCGNTYPYLEDVVVDFEELQYTSIEKVSLFELI